MTDINAIVAHYVTLRDHKSKLDAEHKARVGEIDAQMKNAETYLLGHMNDSNQKNAGFAAGTVIVTDKVLPSIEDKGVLMEFIKSSGNVELLQSRVSSTAVKEYMESNNQMLPPGVKVITSREISIRRK
jgi:hypothetical protein